MNISGTLINYYVHCPTQCWLFANRLNLEDNSEEVRIGKVLHELREEKSKNTEISIDNVKIDRLTRDYLIEVKKSDSDPQAVKWQVLLYLYKLRAKGIERKGRIEYIEKNHATPAEIIELTPDNEADLVRVVGEIETLIDQPQSPKPILAPKCKKCAYYDYCFI
jgi:CRISPR-associated exonuclease Cas4